MPRACSLNPRGSASLAEPAMLGAGRIAPQSVAPIGSHPCAHSGLRWTWRSCKSTPPHAPTQHQTCARAMQTPVNGTVGDYCASFYAAGLPPLAINLSPAISTAPTNLPQTRSPSERSIVTLSKCVRRPPPVYNHARRAKGALALRAHQKRSPPCFTRHPIGPHSGAGRVLQVYPFNVHHLKIYQQLIKKTIQFSKNSIYPQQQSSTDGLHKIQLLSSYFHH